MPTSRIQRIFLLAGITSLFVAYMGLWFRFINDPVERTGSDFIAFYAAGRVAKEYGFSSVYTPDLQQDIQEAEVGFPLVRGQVLLYNHLPFLIPILRLLASDDYVGSFYRWVVLLLIIYSATLSILSMVLQSSGTSRQTIWLLGISSFLFLPLFFSLMNGQDTAVLLLGAALWMYGLITGREWLAGIGLSLTTVRPHVSIALAIPMLFSHRKVFLAYILGSGVLAALSVLIVGVGGARDYINILLISAGGEWHGMKEEAMLNLIGMLTRTLPFIGATIIRATGWLVFGTAILVLSYLWVRSKTALETRISLTVIVALFTTPHLHFHDLTLLLVPVYALVLSAHLKNFAAIAFPIAASLLLLVSNLSPVLQYSTPYILMAVLAYLPYHTKESLTLTSPHRSQSPEK